MDSAVLTWAGRLDLRAVGVLGAIRLIRGLEIGVAGGDLWVCGPLLEAEDESAVARVPWAERYELIGGGLLRRSGRRLPDGELPQISRAPLAEWLRARLGVWTAKPAVPQRVGLELRPDARLREPGVVEAATEDWLVYAQTAPAIRLLPLSFAVDAANRDCILIRGAPLPPIPGLQFVEEEGIAVPAGLRPWPAVSAATLREALGVRDGELAVLRAGADWSRIPRTAWIPASRAAVRALMS